MENRWTDILAALMRRTLALSCPAHYQGTSSGRLRCPASTAACGRQGRRRPHLARGAITRNRVRAGRSVCAAIAKTESRWLLSPDVNGSAEISEITRQRTDWQQHAARPGRRPVCRGCGGVRLGWCDHLDASRTRLTRASPRSPPGRATPRRSQTRRGSCSPTPTASRLAPPSAARSRRAAWPRRAVRDEARAGGICAG